MKLKLVVVDLELTKRQKVTGLAALAATLVTVAGAIAVAAAPPPFVAGETLTATNLNASFDAITARVAALEAPPATVTAHGRAPQPGTLATDTIYTHADLALTPGSWLVVGNAILSTSYADLDGLGLYDATAHADVPDSIRDAHVVAAGTGQSSGFSTTQIVTVTVPTTLQLKAFRHGSSAISFADLTMNGPPIADNAHKLTAWRLR